MRNNDKWGALSIKDRALLIDMYLKNGVQELSEMKKHYNGIPYRDFNTSDYDYFNASPEMIPTEEDQHWDSRNPHTGRLLKGENHPTFDLMVDGENKAGYKIVRGYNGELYSIPNTPNNYVENYNSFGGGGDTKSFWQKILESGQSARDARVGALGAQQVRDLYSEGKNEEAQKLAEQYAKANTTGISLAAGSVSPSLLGDLAITGATTLADTLIEGDTKNLGKNLVVNSIGDVIGGTFQYAPKLYKWVKNKANDVLNISTFDDAVNSAVEFYKRNFNPDIKASDFSIIEADNLPKNVNGEYVHGSRWIRIGENKNHTQQRGTIGHEIRHHEDADLNAPDELGSFIIGDDAVYGVDYGRQKLTEEEKQILKKAYGETKIVGEHPAINVDFKEFLEEMYIKENEKIPSAEELNTYIENLPYQLVSLARGVSSYATPWSVLKTALFPNNVKKALTSVKKYGGKLNKFANGGRILDGNEKEQTLSGEPLIRRVARSAYNYGSPEPIWDITNTPGITEWYDSAYNNASNIAPYPETETIQEIPEIMINPMNTVTNFNLREPLPFVNTPIDNKAFLKTITSFTPKEKGIITTGYPSLSRDYFTSYVRTPVRNLRWKAQKFNGWSDEDLNYLYDKLGEAGWDPKAVMYGIDKETNFRTHVKNKNTSAVGLAQLTREQMKTLFGENADKIYEEYANGTRSVKDVVDDTIKQYRWMYDRIKTERDNMGYGRLKINLLAPNASLDSIVSDVIYKHSLTDEQKRHLKKGKSTYRDLMKVYDKEFAERFTKK